MKRLFKRSNSSSNVSSSPANEQRTAQRTTDLLNQHSSTFASSSIGYLCGSGKDDWARILELCEGCSNSTKIAEETARSLRKEIEHGRPDAQQRAARLLVIISRNTTDRFKLQLAQKKFLDVTDKVYKNKSTQQSVKDMLQKSFSVLAYEFQSDSDLSAVTNLYNNKLKRAEDPINGSALDASDPVFDPTVRNSSSNRQRPIQSMDLWREAEIAKSSASMLVDALGFTKIEELDSNDIIKEFYANCQKSQSVFIDAIPWAADRAEQSTHQSHQAGGELRPPLENSTETEEQKLYAKLLDSNSSLTEAFKAYDDETTDAQRRKRQAEEEALIKERSMTDTRMQQNGQHDPYSNLMDANFAQDASSSSSLAAPIAPSTNPLSNNAFPRSQSPPTSLNQSFYRQPGEDLNHQSSYDFQAISSPPPNHSPQVADSDSFRSSSPSSLSRRLSSRNPYSSLVNSSTQEDSPSLQQLAIDSPSKFASKNPYAAATHPTKAEDPFTSSPVEASFPRPSSPHAMPPIAETEVDRNPFHQLSNVIPNSTFNETYASSPTRSYRTHRTASNASTLITPVEPSEKALGKMKRYSLYGDSFEDVARQEELQRQEEEKLRSRYRGSNSHES